MTLAFGNTLAHDIIYILKGFIGPELRKEIKQQFKQDTFPMKNLRMQTVHQIQAEDSNKNEKEHNLIEMSENKKIIYTHQIYCINMYKKDLLFIIISITICFTISIGFATANENISTDTNLTSTDYSNTLNDVNNDLQSISQNNSNLISTNADNKDITSKNEDNKTINYLIKNKEKYDNIVKKSTKKDRTFKLGKYKLTITKNDYKKFLYAKFIGKYVKSKKNITLLEKIFKIKQYEFSRSTDGCVSILLFPSYMVTKKTNKIITQKIGTFKDYKTKNIYFKNYKKAKKFNKQLSYLHKIKYDKNRKKYYIKVYIETYKNIKTKKARVNIELEYYNNEYRLTAYTKYDRLDWHLQKSVIEDYSIYKSSKNIQKLNKSKIKKSYNY